MKRAVAVLCAMAMAAGTVVACFSERGGGLTGLSAQCEAKVKAAGIPSGNVVIAIEGFAFSPVTQTVARSRTVTWVNCETTAGLQHTVTSDGGNELASPLFGPGQIYSHTFATAGTFAYHCTPHPTMKATVVVQ